MFDGVYCFFWVEEVCFLIDVGFGGLVGCVFGDFVGFFVGWCDGDEVGDG